MAARSAKKSSSKKQTRKGKKGKKPQKQASSAPLKVAAVVPPLARVKRKSSYKRRWRYELEALGSLATIEEVSAESEQEFLDKAGDCDAIITSWGFPLTRSILEQLSQCRVVGVGSVGVDMVDVDAATDAGIVVTNTPDIFIEEVADHTLGLLLALSRQLKGMNRIATEDRWYEGRPALNKTRRLLGQTLGLIAFGNVSRAVARRAKAFGLRVIAYDPYVSELKMTEEGVEPVGLNELLERSDFVSIHALLNEETHHLLGGREFRRMKETACLINCARGPIVREKALINALEKGQILGAGLDVLEQEPPDPDNPLLFMDNVIVTPHVASATTRMRPEVRRRVGREVALVLKGRWPMSCVNPTVMPRVPLARWQPFPMERGPNR